MSRSAAARASAVPAGRSQTARRASAAAPARRPVPRPAPARRAAPAPSARRPRRGAARPAGAPTLVQRAGIAARARVARTVETVLHGPGLIGVVFLLLVGVVFANVALLQKNRQVTGDAARVSELKRENATLRADIAALGSSERIQQVASERGLVLPAPDQIRYLRSNPSVDAVAAAKQVDEGAAALAASTAYADPAATQAPSASDPSASYADPSATAGTPLASASDPAAAVP